MSGKGDKPRHNLAKYGEGWERVFKKKAQQLADEIMKGVQDNPDAWLPSSVPKIIYGGLTADKFSDPE